jgi:hypothetical protein
LRKHKTTTVLAAVTLLLLLLVISSLPVAAHPPSEMTVIYNDRVEVLTVSIYHDVKDKVAHRVEMIEVYLNNALVIERPIAEQPRDRFNERFALKASEGDVIRVKACCNLEGCIERTLEVGPGITVEGDAADTLDMMIMVHAAIQIVSLVLALIAIPGGMHFYRAWRTRTKPTGKRRVHTRIGMGAAIGWGVGALGGMWIVYMTSGDYVGSPHGWLAIATFVSAGFAAYSANPKFRKAGYAVRMQTHVPLAVLTLVLAVITIVSGMVTAGMM